MRGRNVSCLSFITLSFEIEAEINWDGWEITLLSIYEEVVNLHLSVSTFISFEFNHFNTFEIFLLRKLDKITIIKTLFRIQDTYIVTKHKLMYK